MAIGRYDQRKNYEEGEANAIGTEYLRADLLPAGDAARVRALLKQYVDLRIASYTTADATQLRDIDTRTAKVQNELWSSVQAPAAVAPTPIVALAVSGMNDVLNSQGYTQAADRNRIPTTAWTLMLVIAVCCNILLGWGAHRGSAGALLRLVLPVVGALAFMLIADIDTPRHGVIHVAPDNLVSLSRSLGAHSGG